MQPVTLVPITEIARRHAVCCETLKRKVAAAGITADAVAVTGRRRIPLFVVPRTAGILSLLTTPDTKAQ